MKKSELSIISETPLSLKALSDILQARGVAIAYTSLSELLSTGDIAEQLGATGSPRRVFPPIAVDILAGFLQEYRDGGGKLPQAPRLLRGYLGNGQWTMDNGQRGSGTAMVVAQPPAGPVSATPSIEELTRIAIAQGEAQGRASAEWARVFTAAEAAAFLRVSTRLLRQEITPSRRIGKDRKGDRWTLKDLMVAAGGIDRTEGGGSGN